jgi:hypothetical protein
MLKIPKGRLFPILAGVVTLAAVGVIATFGPSAPRYEGGVTSTATSRGEPVGAGNVEAQGLRCPSVLDATLQGEALVRVNCDNNQNFRIRWARRAGAFA